MNEGRLLRVGSLQSVRHLGADVGHQAMPAAGRLALARGQRARLARTLEELGQIHPLHERRDREDHPFARVCLHHLGDTGIGKRLRCAGRLAGTAR